MDSEKHASLYYPSRVISDLPQRYLLSTRSGAQNEDVWLTYLLKKQIPALHSLAEEAADNDYNVGVDEFKTQEKLEYVLSLSEAFAFHHKEELVGGVILQPSMYSTSWRTHTCDIRIILSRWLRERGGYRLLLDIGQDIIPRLGLLYDSAVTSVFLSSYKFYTETREAGFSPTAIIANMGYTKRGRDKPQRVALFYKKLTAPAKLRSLEDMVSFCNRPDVFGTEEEFISKKQLKVPYLPVIHQLKNGQTILLRNYEKSDDKSIYNILLKVTDKEEGYSIDEYPSLNCFRNYNLINSYAILLEDVNNLGNVVGFIIFGRSCLLRTSDDYLLADIAVYIDPQYRGNGLGIEIILMSQGIMKDVGFKAVNSETFFNNNSTKAIASACGFTMTGFAPECVHLDNEGWIDCIYAYRHLGAAKGYKNEILRPKQAKRVRVEAKL